MRGRQLQLDDMTISEAWRWRLLTLWVILFTLLSSYAIFKVRDVAEENRDALCAIHAGHVTTDRAVQILMERGDIDAGPIKLQIETEEAILSELGC